MPETITRETLEADDALVPALRCPDCTEIFPEDEELLAIYECCTEYTREGSADGESNRCPICNKFGSKTGSYALPCGCGVPLEEIEAVEDEDGILVEIDAYIESGGATAAAINEKEEEEREQHEAERKAALKARTREVPITEVKVGEMFLGLPGEEDHYPLEVKSIQHEPEGEYRTTLAGTRECVVGHRPARIRLWTGGMGFSGTLDTVVLILDPEEDDA
jgi:hypothetical protein